MGDVDTGVLIDRLEGLLPLVADHAPAANEARRPSREVMGAFADAGLLRLIMPKGYGGLGVSPRTFLDIVEWVARVDGSSAWTIMTCNEEAGIVSAYLEPESIAGHFSACPNTVITGSGMPKGSAVRADGGWNLTGRWDFVSGSTAADRVVLASMVAGAKPAELCFVLIPTDEITIEDTWNTHGLRGTASCSTATS